MGTWGTNLLENDTAADVAGFWNEFVGHGRQRDPDFWTPERTWALLRQMYCRSGVSPDAPEQERASEVLAIGALFIEHGIALPADLLELLGRTANGELRPDQLKLWGSDGRSRRRALEGLLEAIGVERAPPPKPVDAAKAEIRQLREWSRLKWATTNGPGSSRRSCGSSDRCSSPMRYTPTSKSGSSFLASACSSWPSF